MNQIILCEEHREILKFYCIDCDKYYCSFCIKNDLIHNENHSCFLTLNISKSQLQELKSLIKDFNIEKENINEGKIDELINEIKAKKEKDLSIIRKLECCVKYRYDYIINSYERII